MAQFQRDSGNKMSLRSEALDQIKRIDSISQSMGSLGDFLVSTLLSILASLVIFAVFPLIALDNAVADTPKVFAIAVTE